MSSPILGVSRNLCSVCGNDVNLWTNYYRNPPGADLGQYCHDGPIFVLGRQLANSTLGLTAAASYAMLSLIPSVLGQAAHADKLRDAIGSRRDADDLQAFGTRPKCVGAALQGGWLFGLGLLMKQPALFFILFGATDLLHKKPTPATYHEENSLRNLIFWIAAITPFGITCLIRGTQDSSINSDLDTSYASQYGKFPHPRVISSGTRPLSRGAHVSVRKRDPGHRSRLDVVGTGWILAVGV